MKNKIILHNIKAYICLVHFLINVKTKMNCKTDFFFYYRIWIRDGLHAGRGLRTTGLDH